MIAYVPLAFGLGSTFLFFFGMLDTNSLAPTLGGKIVLNRC